MRAERIFVENEKFDSYGREKMDPKPISVRLGSKPRKPSIGEQVRAEIQRELARRAEEDDGYAPIPVFGDEDDDGDGDEEYGASPHEVVVDPETGEVATRGELIMRRENAAFDAALAEARQAKRKSAHLDALAEQAAKAAAQPQAAPEPKPASGGVKQAAPEPKPASGGVKWDVVDS